MAPQSARIAELEAQLLDQRWQAQVAVQAARISLYHWDIETDELTFSHDLPALYGIESNEPLTGEVFRNQIHPEDRDKVAQEIEASLAEAREYFCEFRVVLASGRVRWVAGRGKWTRSTETRNNVLVGANWDITASKRETERFRLILDGLNNVAAILLGPDGKARELNAAAIEYGRASTACEQIAQPAWQLSWWPADHAEQDRFREAAERAKTGETVCYDTQIECTGDAPIDIEFCVAPLYDEDNELLFLLVTAYEITGRKQHEEEMQLLNRELQHRIANVFTVIASLLRMSTAFCDDVDTFVEVTIERLNALENAHQDTFGISGKDGAELNSLARRVLMPWRQLVSDRLFVEGPCVRLSRGEATAFGLILHELATNASKYGALKNGDGHVRLSWSSTASQIDMTWQEHSDAPVAQPTRQGFGMTVIGNLAEHYLHGQADFAFAEDGLRVEVHATR
ncbi:MAG: PAS domain-containing protein [Geminicoccaceae bacterium]